VALVGCTGETLPVSDVSQTSATLNAQASCDGTRGKPCYFQFTYKSSADAVTRYAKLHGPITNASSGMVRETIAGLTPGTTYEARFCGQGDNNVRKWACASPVSFTTAAAAPGTVPPPPATNTSPKVLAWALGHSDWWSKRWTQTNRLSVTKTVEQMQAQEPPIGSGPTGPRKATQGCDCSSFVRWAYAQAGIDVGTYTGNMWTAKGTKGFPLNMTDAAAVLPNGDRVARGAKPAGARTVEPPGGWRVGDLAFKGVTGIGAGIGHVAIYMGDGKIVQCSFKPGSNQGAPLDPPKVTGWMRYDSVSG